jgi:proteasome lid subunit RPN8/RPN11
MITNWHVLPPPMHDPYYCPLLQKSWQDQCSSWLVCLVHNHPSGDPMQSRADIDTTRQSGELAKLLGVARTTRSLSVATASDYRRDGCAPE